MKFKTSTTPTFEELRKKLTQRFPEYTLKMEGKKVLFVKKSNTCGVAILIRPNKLILNGNFPSSGTRIIFAVTVVLLGFLIPLIIYFVTFHKKFKELEKEVGDFLQTEYANL